MHSEDNDPISCLFTLLRYRQLAEDANNHQDILGDKTAVTFLAYVLDSNDPEILDASLTSLELLVADGRNCQAIKSTIGVVEALQALVNKKASKNPALSARGEKLLQLLNTSHLPNDGAKCKEKVKSPKKKKKITLQVHGLHLETQKDLEDAITKTVKGVLSLIVDVEHQRCIVTVFEHVEPKTLALAISEHTNMQAKLVARNKYNQEMLVSLIDSDYAPTFETEDLPPYLDEKDSPVTDKAVRSIKDIRIAASEWFSSAAGFLQKSFYW